MEYDYIQLFRWFCNRNYVQVFEAKQHVNIKKATATHNPALIIITIKSHLFIYIVYANVYIDNTRVSILMLSLLKYFI